ncbi:MCE family protein [Amycolatopsis anabasis]|uniref:MCE family protein n=1 Tax=Amycolatopsis anabasis TaxID=1840409 RepID=UPI00131E27E9|nr:MCE family protein [Amycolatopsis anabasis]
MGKWYRIGAAAVVAVLLVAGGLWYFRDKPTLTVSADFAHADGIFPGNSVNILGVPVGTVKSIEPRGGTVRITMSLPADTRIPATARAWVLTPAVVSEKYVELSPAYESGDALGEGAVIPVERTHSPIKWDDLVRSLDSLLTALGPERLNSGGGLGQALSVGANLIDGNGQPFRDAVRGVAQASELLAGKSDDVTGLLDKLNQLVQLLVDNKSTVDSLTGSVSQATQLFDQQRGAITNTIGQLSGVLGDLSELIQRHGKPLTEDLTKLSQLSGSILSRQQALTELLDTAPLGFENWTRAISPDDRIRIRLNISTNFAQFPAGKALCDRLPIPFCTGAGITNPIPFPPNIAGLLGGAAR